MKVKETLLAICSMLFTRQAYFHYQFLQQSFRITLLLMMIVIIVK